MLGCWVSTIVMTWWSCWRRNWSCLWRKLWVISWKRSKRGNMVCAMSRDKGFSDTKLGVGFASHVAIHTTHFKRKYQPWSYRVKDFDSHERVLINFYPDTSREKKLLWERLSYVLGAFQLIHSSDFSLSILVRRQTSLCLFVIRPHLICQM